ncbi:MAG TPA: hypothetical protein VLS96_03695 [Nodosilinea sp.]|nr:hypothetical protein [Nodosilinea sp.]
MQTRRDRPTRSWTRGKQGIASFFVMFSAVGFLLYQLMAKVLFAFAESPSIGIRSLAAALFPILVLVYLGFIARLQMPVRESRSPIINNFIVFLFWTMLVLGIDASIQLVNLPVQELLYSFTLAAMLWRYRYQDSFKSLIACSYGVLAGALAAIIIFGLNPIAM